MSLDVLFTYVKEGRKKGTYKNKKVYFRCLEDVDKIVNALSQINRGNKQRRILKLGVCKRCYGIMLIARVLIRCLWVEK